MKNVKIELTYDEVKTIYKSLGVLKRFDEEQTQRELFSKGAKKNLDMEIEKCMELLRVGGKVYKAWEEAHKDPAEFLK